MTPNTVPAAPLVLASASPRRLALFHTAGLDPRVIPSSYEETVPFPMQPAERAMFFALGKALDVRAQMNTGAACLHGTPEVTDDMIIGADTIVVFEDRIMEKPRDKEDGMNMLMDLSGATHQVITGVCLADTRGLLTKCFYEVSDVTFCTYSRPEMDAYLDTDEAYDKAGGYGIQGTFSRYVTDVSGDVDNVIGFPMSRFFEESLIYEKILKNGRL